tara:strand:- start:5922 stop:6152 length:231 start_codon:yes stop_codon:yes gene_type:complete
MIITKTMSERFHTTIQWQGPDDIADKLANLIPENVEYEITQEGGMSILSISVVAGDMETLRSNVDYLLTLFSGHDE